MKNETERIIDLFLSGKLQGFNHARHVAAARILKGMPHGKELMHLGIQVTATRGGMPEKYSREVTDAEWEKVPKGLPALEEFADVLVPKKGHVHVVIGPVGSGKSTYALGLCREHAAVRFTLDEWFTSLFSPDRPASGVVEWYVERAARCVEQIWRVARAVVESGTDVVLEVGLLRRAQREGFYAKLEEAGCAYTVHVVDAPRDVRRERVLRRNEERGETFSMIVPMEIFEFASDQWEPPEDAEVEGRVVRADFGKAKT